jgi:two-component sensor histidine kinase
MGAEALMGDVLESIRRWLPRVASAQAYLLALALIGIGILVRFPLDAVAQNPLPPYITLYPAIVLAAFAGGVRVGFFAAFVSAVAAWFLWMAPLASESLAQTATAVVYIFTASLTVTIAGTARLLLNEVDAAKQERESAARESVHRIKNLLAVIQSISTKIAADATDVPAYRQRLDARLRALATAQDILVRRDHTDVPLPDLVQTTLGPFIPNPRLELRTSATTLVPRAAVTQLSMALYELATNSLKYGALASADGLVRLESRVSETSCTLEWREIGMAHVAVGDSAGLGSRLIRSALQSIEGGIVRYDVSPQAVTCLFEWPCVA